MLVEIKGPILDELSITVGNFDGVHRGHRQFFKHIKEMAPKNKLLVITFTPHPNQVLHGRHHFLINSYADRKELLRECGVDFIWEIPFTRDFSSLSPEAFLDQFILTFKNVKQLFLGHDFGFGANKQGNFELAKRYCIGHHLELYLQDEYKFDCEKISSSTIRQSLLDGDMEKSSQLLGRNYFLKGIVVKGEGRGKTIGFPTANVSCPDELLPPQSGVYMTKVEWRKMMFYSVTNIGVNPTFKDDQKLSIETHLLDFNQEIYGEEVKVIFCKKLREEKKFSSVNDLVQQISKDVALTRDYYK